MSDLHPARSMPREIDAVLAQLQSLVGQEAVAEDYVRLRIAVVQAQAAALASLAREAETSRATVLSPGSRLAPEQVPFNGTIAQALLGALEKACRTIGRAAAAWSRLTSIVEGRAAVLENLVREAIQAREEADLTALADRLAVPRPLLAFAGRLLAAPFVIHAACAMEDPPALSASAGPCPRCGSPAGLAMLRAEDGRRRLHCSLCGHAWLAPRLECPFCGNADQAALGRLAVDGVDARWIETCHRCGGYLKTVDVRRLPDREEPFPLVEETAGLYLDLIAERHGYRRPLPYAALW